jgi:hypothetical protein
MVDAADPEIGLALGLLVAVDQDGLLAALARDAEEARLLAAGAEGGAVGEGPVLHRHGGIVLLDAALHLGKQRLAQFFRPGQHLRLIGVFGLQMGADVGSQHRGIAKHLLPVLRPQPGIIVRSARCRDGVS